ncbi:hypothetical protein FOZ63_028514, partial [Perkinsus olseni]
LTESSINKAVRVHLRIPTTVLSDQQVADFVREIDADESGSVSLKELIQFLEKAPVGSVEDTLEEGIRKARGQAREQMHLTMSRVRRRMIAGMKANKVGYLPVVLRTVFAPAGSKLPVPPPSRRNCAVKQW